jgi:hypothetical protein
VAGEQFGLAEQGGHHGRGLVVEGQGEAGDVLEGGADGAVADAVGQVVEGGDEAGEVVADEAQDEVGLVGEVAVEGGFGEAGGEGDLPGGGARGAEGADDLFGGVQDVVARGQAGFSGARAHRFPLDKEVSVH